MKKFGIKPTDILEGHLNLINIYGLNTIPVIINIGEIFKINKYILADLLDTNLRPKADEQDGQLSLNIKVPPWDTTIDKFETEQITFILGENFLLCFQEIEGDLFNPIRERIKLKGKGYRKTKKIGILLFFFW